ncbi:unnamed protein product [Calypogeia fissa]
MDMIVVCIILGAVVYFICGFFWKRPLHISSLKGKHVLITGASSGIGLALAEQALSEGAYVTVTGRNSATLKNAIAFLSKRVADSSHRIEMKVADVADYKAMTDTIRESDSWKPIDVVICNAGLTRSGYLDQVAVEDLELTVRTNILGVVYAVHAVLPLMKRRSPKHPMAIVLIGSLASLFLMYGNSVYTGTKYALKGIAESLRLELLPYSIKVNLICPGFVRTPFLDEAEKADDLQTLMKDVNLYDRNQAHSPEEVAQRTLKAVKEGSSIVTMTPVLGSALLMLARGFMPDDSILKTLQEMLLYPLVRLFSIVAQIEMHRKIRAYHRKQPVGEAVHDGEQAPLCSGLS